jgi:hypothetical protein
VPRASQSLLGIASILVLIGTLALGANAQTTTNSLKTAAGQVGASQTTTINATVVSIDLGSRDLVLIDSHGKMHKLNVSDQARNLDQVRVGDRVSAEYSEAISLQLRKHAIAAASPAQVQTAVFRSPKGAKPAGVAGREVTALATVIAINLGKSMVSVRGPLGNEYDLQVSDPVQLNAIAKGDEVEVVYTEALAIAVRSAPSPP